MTICSYSLFLIYPTSERLDQIVAGAIFYDGNRWDVRVGSDLHKMQAIDPSFKTQRLENVKEFLSKACSTASDFDQVRNHVTSLRANVFIHPSTEAFLFSDTTQYEQQIRAVLNESVDVTKPRLIRRTRNRVRRNLRTRFQAADLWSKRDADIENHCVVEQYTLSPEHGIVAEFALRNGSMHVTETIDFALHTAKAKRVEAQSKTLVLDEAQRVCGDGTKKYVVVAGSNSEGIESSLNLLKDRATVFMLENDSDMNRYMDIITAAAGPRQLIR